MASCRDVRSLGLLFSSIAGVADFLTQHLVWNFVELNSAWPRVELDTIMPAPAGFSFEELTRQISKQNTAKCVERFCTDAESRRPKRARSATHQWVDVFGSGSLPGTLDSLHFMDVAFRELQSQKLGFCQAEFVVKPCSSTAPLARFDFGNEDESCDYHNYLSNLCMLEKAIVAMIV